ncbi:MAG TPA: competence/damage-inducible protein A [Bryobacteraceae bacterium]|nr:competence/damage-inducible protein A [Bryobacteraceae bacterium]
MDAEIIAVGSELLTPERLDTNSLYLTAELNNLGVEVAGKCIVGDNRDRLAQTVAEAMRRCSIVVLTGGLGPTEDDVTRDAVAQAIGCPLVFHPEIAGELERRFAAMGRKMSEINKRQAFVIEGAEILPNGRGTAPGQWVTWNGSVAILLPGPPHELKAMFEQHCLARLQAIVPKQAIRTAFLRITGMPESDLDALISPVYQKYSHVATTILAANGDLQVHLRARCDTEGEADAVLAQLVPALAALLGDRLYSQSGESLEVLVGRLLRERGATLAVAESCTGGMLGARLTSVPGSSQYFLGGFLTYSNHLKRELLGVPAQTLAEFGAVSSQTAEAMAAGARERTGATYAVSITGVAGPDGGTTEKPVGLVYIGVAGPDGTTVLHRRFIGDRERIRIFTTQAALDLLRRKLEGLS